MGDETPHTMLSSLLGGLGHLQALQFTGMGGPMGVYENYDTDACQDGGTFCVARDNEGYYGDPRMDALAVSGAGAACPPAFDCNGLDPHQFADWGGPGDGIF